MSDTNDDPKPPEPKSPDAAAHPHESLLIAIRAALAPGAATDSRSAGAIACRTALGILEPAGARVPLPTPNASTSPLDTAIGALGSVPREQLLPFIAAGLRSVLGRQPPTYRSRPNPPPPREPDR